MSYSTPQPPRNPNSRATQAPLTNPSLPSLSTPHRFSPYPTALRPSLFHSVPRPRATALPSPSFATPSSSAAYAPPHNTPSSAFPPARNSEFGKSPHRAAHKGKHANPFDRLSAPEFDNFVDSLTSSIRSVLAGPVVEPASVRRRREREERAREREVAQEERRRLAQERELQREREEAELEAKEEDVFGEVKRVGRLEDGLKGDEEERETEVVVIESDEEEEEEEQIEDYEEDAEAEERHPSSASPPPPFFSFAQTAPVPIPERSSSPFRGHPSPHRKPLFVPDVDVDEDDAIARFEEETAGEREMSYGLNTAESAPEEEGGDYSEDEYGSDEPTAQIQGRRLVDPFGRTLQYEDGSGSAEEYTLAGDAVEYEEFVEEGNDASTGREADISASVTPAPPRPKAKKAVETIELDSSSSDDGGDEGADEDELEQDERPDAADLRLEQLLEMQLEGAVVPDHAQYSERVDYHTDAGADADVEEADERQMVAEAQWHNAPQDGPDRMVDVLEGTFPSASASTSATEAEDYVPQELQDELERHMAEPEGGERMVLPYPGDEAGSAVADGAEVGEEEEFFGQGVPGDEVEMGREEPEQFDELEFEEKDGGEAKAPTYSSEESDDLGPRIPYAAKGKARVPQSPSVSDSPIQRLSSLSPSPSQSSGSGSSSASEPDEWNPALLATYTLPELSRVLAMLRGQLEQAVEADSRWIGEIQRKLEDAEGIWEAMVAEARARGEVVQEYEDEEGEEDEDSEEFVDRSAFDDEATDTQKAPPLSPEQRFVEDQLSAIASQLVDMQQQGDTGGELHVPGSALDYPGDTMVDSAQENERESAMEVDAVAEPGLTVVDEDAPLPSAAGSPALEHEVPPAVPPVAEDLESSLPPVQVVSVPPSPSAEPTPAPALSSSTETDALPAAGEPDTGLTLVDEDAPIPSADAATPALEVPPVVPFSPTKAESSLSASPFVPTPPSTTTDLHLSSHFRVEPGPTPSLDSPLDLPPPSSTVTDVNEPVEELEVERIEPDESVAEEVPPLAETESAMEVDRVEQVDAVPAPKGEADAGLTIVDEDAPIPSADVGSPAAVDVPPVIPFTPPVAEQLESPTPPVQVVSTAPSVEPIPGPSMEHQAVPAPAQTSAPDAGLTLVDEDAPVPSADAATPALEVPSVVPFSPTSAEPSLSASPFVPAPPSATTGPHLSSHFRVEPGPVPSLDSPLNLPPPSATVTDVDEPIEELEYETEDQVNELHPLGEMQDVSRVERRAEASDFERPQSPEDGLMVVDDDEPTAAQPQPSAAKDERPSPTSVRLGATPQPASDEIDRDEDGPPPVVNGSAPPQNFDIVPSPPASPPRPTEAPESAILELAAPTTEAAPSRTPAAEPQPAPSPAVEAAPSTAEDMIRFDEFVNDSDDEHGEEEEEDQLASSVTDEAASSLIAPSGRRRGVAVLGLPLGEDVLTSPVALAHGSDDEGDEADAKGEEAGEVVLSSDDESDAGEVAVGGTTTNGVTEEPAKEKQVSASVAPASAPIGRRSEDEMEEGEVFEDQVDETTPVAAASAAPRSPPRIKNVQEPGEWDPSQPIRFGDAAPAPPSAVAAEVEIEAARATAAEEPLEQGGDEQLASSTPAEQLEDEAEEKEGAEPAAAQTVEAEESSAPVQAVIEPGLVEVEELEEGEIEEPAMVVEMEETVVVEMELADGEMIDGAVQPNEIQSVRGSSVATDVGTVGSRADIDVELVAESVTDVVMAGLDTSDSLPPIEVATDLLEQAVEIVDVAASTAPLPTATPVDVEVLPEDRRGSTIDEAEQGELGATEPAPPEEDSQGAPPAEEDSSAVEVASKTAPSEADAAPSDANDAAPQEDVEAAVHDDLPQVHDDQPQEDVTLPELVEEQPSAKDPLAAPSGADETIVAVSPSVPAAAPLPSPAPSSDPDDELLLVPHPARAAPNAPAPSSSAAAPKRKPRSSSSEPSKLGFAAPGPLTALPASTAVQPGAPSPIRRSSRLSSTAAAGPAEPAKGKRGRKSDELGGESSDASSPSPAKRTRRAGPSKLREQEVAGDEAPPSPTSPLLRVHHHHHRHQAPAPAASTSTSTSATAEPPVTRSRCHFNRLRIRSKENPDSAPYLFNIPACALASPLAQETMEAFSVEDLGPVPSGSPAHGNANANAEASSSTTCPAIPLGGRGLDSTDAGAARLMHERHSALIPDADVESVVRRIAGNELWDEGACEVLPREREREGEGEGEGKGEDGDGAAKEAEEEEEEGKGKGRGKGRKREAEEDGAATTAKPPSKGKKRK